MADAAKAAQAAKEKLARTKVYMANMFKGGVIVAVENGEQAKIAEKLGARGVEVVAPVPKAPALEVNTTVTADPAVVREVLGAVVLPVVGRIRYGHMIEAQVMKACGVNAIDEHEGTTNASDEVVPKADDTLPYFAGVADLKEALCAISAGASLIRTQFKEKEENPKVEVTVGILNKIYGEIAALKTKTEAELKAIAKDGRCSVALVEQIKRLQRLPVPLFADGGIVLPTDVAMVMDLKADGAIVSQVVFQVPDPARRVRSMVMAAAHFRNPAILLQFVEDT
ncbi:hypothetical protein LPJ70_004005 [Coemansia sp. RSA 2708]|nr:hypothetical protein LPJ70_004005 [Coemansia sp. RSA 2708]